MRDALLLELVLAAIEEGLIETERDLVRLYLWLRRRVGRRGRGGLIIHGVLSGEAFKVREPGSGDPPWETRRTPRHTSHRTRSTNRPRQCGRNRGGTSASRDDARSNASRDQTRVIHAMIRLQSASTSARSATSHKRGIHRARSAFVMGRVVARTRRAPGLDRAITAPDPSLRRPSHIA